MSVDYYIYIVVRNRNGRLELKRVCVGHNNWINYLGMAKVFIELLEQLLGNVDYHRTDLVPGNDHQQLLHRWITYQDREDDYDGSGSALSGVWVHNNDTYRDDGHDRTEETVMASAALLGPMDRDDSNYIFYDEYHDKRDFDAWLRTVFP